mmetsp:Transcript_42477/g.76753  ORF Transcript_42477/g.76753 Transcript_42477/m.76753 type:complete len:256 (+) Transcript_42477:1373-2140(+)
MACPEVRPAPVSPNVWEMERILLAISAGDFSDASPWRTSKGATRLRTVVAMASTASISSMMRAAPAALAAAMRMPTTVPEQTHRAFMPRGTPAVQLDCVICSPSQRMSEGLYAAVTHLRGLFMVLSALHRTSQEPVSIKSVEFGPREGIPQAQLPDPIHFDAGHWVQPHVELTLGEVSSVQSAFRESEIVSSRKLRAASAAVMARSIAPLGHLVGFGMEVAALQPAAKTASAGTSIAHGELATATAEEAASRPAT